MPEPIYLSPEMGVPLLKTLWNWKLLSTAAIGRSFYPHSTNINSPYNYLLHLKRKRYVTVRWDESGQHALWSLDLAGFKAIRNLLPPLREEGYRAEAPRHDWLVTAFHLGDWLISRPSGVQLFSEQALRRMEVEAYPSWVPKIQSHRPDGYWHHQDASVPRTVALEVELNRKKAPLYQSVGSFYGDMRQINRVLWLVEGLTDAARIEEYLNKGPGSRSNIHSFVRLGSFMKLGWSATIEHGPGKGHTVATFLHKALLLPNLAIEGQSKGESPVKALLETRIKPTLSAPSKVFGASAFSRPTATSIAVGFAPNETR